MNTISAPLGNIQGCHFLENLGNLNKTGKFSGLKWSGNSRGISREIREFHTKITFLNVQRNEYVYMK